VPLHYDITILFTFWVAIIKYKIKKFVEEKK